MASQIIVPKPKLTSFDVSIRNMGGSYMIQNKFSKEAGDAIKIASTKGAKTAAAALNIEKAFKGCRRFP